jgi:hypothetical protein
MNNGMRQKITLFQLQRSFFVEDKSRIKIKKKPSILRKNDLFVFVALDT